MDAFNDYLGKYYPLLTLGGVSSRASQYRDAERGVRYEDRIPSRELFGRALNDQMDAFQQSIPQYLQYQRQLALDKEKLAYDREQRKYQQQLNPMLLEQQRISNKLNQSKLGAYDNYYQQIESAPIPDAQKEYFRGLTPQQGLAPFQSLMQSVLTRKPPDKNVILPAGDPRNPYKDRPVVWNISKNTFDAKEKISPDVKQASVDDPNVQFFAKQMNLPAEDIARMITVTTAPGETPQYSLSPLMSSTIQKEQIEKAQPTVSKRFDERFNDQNPLSNFEDLAVIGITDAGDQKEFVFNQVLQGKIDRNSELAKQALQHVNSKHIKMGRNGVVISEGFRKDYPKNKPFTAGAPETYFVRPKDTVSSIVEQFKKKGITVNPKQLVASNPQFFQNKPYELAVKEMPHSEQLDGALMTIPVGGGDVSEAQRVEARETNRDQGIIHFPGYAKIIPHKNTTVKQEISLNDDYNEMVDLYQTVDQYTELMDNINARGILPTGSKERGYVQGLRWRLINKIQVLRDYGVLTPGEIDVIEKSAPNFNSFWNLLGKAKKGNEKLADDSVEVWDTDRFVKGVLQVLRDEGFNKAKRLRATMDRFNIPVIEYERSIETGNVRIYGRDTGAFQISGGSGEAVPINPQAEVNSF
ncbi:hypothetical protein [uncultured Mediterranean phage uvMED]|nr:hypothetical protein [uncultured Mediterranean phage uvMED]